MSELLGYVGPGAGLGFVGSLLAVLAVVAVGMLGLVLYPLKLVMARYQKRSATHSADQATSCRNTAGHLS